MTGGGTDSPGAGSPEFGAQPSMSSATVLAHGAMTPAMRSLSTAANLTSLPPVNATTLGYPRDWNRPAQKVDIEGGVQSTQPRAKSFTLSSRCNNANSRTSRLHGGAHRVQNAMIHLRLSDPGTFSASPSTPPRPPALPSPTPSDILCASAVAASKVS